MGINGDDNHQFMGISWEYHKISGSWCNNHPEKYEVVNGKDDNPYMKWKIENV